jgi:hypothetical protein
VRRGAKAGGGRLQASKQSGGNEVERVVISMAWYVLKPDIPAAQIFSWWDQI